MALNVQRAAPPHPASTPPRRVPIVRGLPVIGVLPEFLRDPPGTVERLALARPGEIIGLRLGPITLHVVSHPDHVQQVLGDPRGFSKGGRMWDRVRWLLGNGLATSDGDFWLRQRRFMQPMFSATHLASLADTMVDVIEREVERIAVLGRTGAALDMAIEMKQLVQQVLLASMFGTRISAGDAAQLGDDVHVALRTMFVRMLLPFIPLRVPLPGDRRYREATTRIDAALMRLVAERRRSGEDRKDLLSLLMHAGGNGMGEAMDNGQLRDQLVSIFVAGSGTTATTLTWAWYELDRHPEIVRKLRAEIDAVLGDRRPTYADLHRLVYTHQVVLETLRLYPPAWMFPRFPERDALVGGFPIPAHASMILSPFITHRDPAFWDRPLVFDPDRFSPERSAGRPRYAYYPFGGGPRQCIGNNLALLEAQLTIVMMVRRMWPRLIPGQRLELDWADSLTPRYGMKMRLELA